MVTFANRNYQETASFELTRFCLKSGESLFVGEGEELSKAIKWLGENDIQGFVFGPDDDYETATGWHSGDNYLILS